MYQEGSHSIFSDNGIKYDLNKLFIITHGRTSLNIPTSELAWILEYEKKKNMNGQMECSSCLDAKFHNERVKNADTSIPVLALKREDKYILIDGVHRLEKAILQQIESLPVIIVGQEELNTTRIID